MILRTQTGLGDNTDSAAVFTATGLVAGNPAQTSVTGVVLDNFVERGQCPKVWAIMPPERNTMRYPRIITLLAIALAHGGVAISADRDRVLEMKAVDFEKLVVPAVASSRHATDAPLICRGVLDRLKAEKFVSDRTVLLCAQANVNAAENRRAGAPARAAAEGFIGDVVSLLVDRQYLRAQLLAQRAMMEFHFDDRAASLQAYKEELEVLESFHLGVELERQTTLIRLGRLMLAQRTGADPVHSSPGDVSLTKAAEAYFLSAQNYPFYSVKDPESSQVFKQRYGEAVRGEIDCHRGDLKGLQDIRFYPAVEPEVRPLLDYYIKEAKSPDK